jgi:hypothetical protein
MIVIKKINRASRVIQLVELMSSRTICPGGLEP